MGACVRACVRACVHACVGENCVSPPRGIVVPASLARVTADTGTRWVGCLPVS